MMTPGRQSYWGRPVEKNLFMMIQEKNRKPRWEAPVVINFIEVEKMLEQLQTYCLVSNQVAFFKHIMISRELINKKVFLENN